MISHQTRREPTPFNGQSAAISLEKAVQERSISLPEIKDLAQLKEDSEQVTERSLQLVALATEQLEGASTQRALQAQQLLQALSDLTLFHAKDFTGMDNSLECQRVMASLTADPLFTDIMIDSVVSGRPGSCFIAHALRKTPLYQKQGVIRQKLLSLMTEDPDSVLINSCSFLPYALNPDNPESIKVLATVVETSHSYNKDLEAAAILSLGDARSIEALNAVRGFFYEPGSKTVTMVFAAIDAMKANINEQEKIILTSLIDGSVLKTAKVLASQKGYKGLSWLGNVIKLHSSYYDVLINKRAEAALVLVAADPILAKKTFLILLKNEIFMRKYSKYNASLVNAVKEGLKNLSEI